MPAVDGKCVSVCVRMWACDCTMRQVVGEEEAAAACRGAGGGGRGGEGREGG